MSQSALENQAIRSVIQDGIKKATLEIETGNDSEEERHEGEDSEDEM